jgi:ribosome-associated protein
MRHSDLKSQVATAIAACENKKAENLTILELEKGSGAFTDYFLICTGTNPRQVQAIADEVELRLKNDAVYPNSVEGYNLAEWVLLDYVDFVVHIFSAGARRYYDLERLWKSAKRITLKDLEGKPSRARRTPAKAAKKKSARNRSAERAPAKSSARKKKSSPVPRRRKAK